MEIMSDVSGSGAAVTGEPRDKGGQSAGVDHRVRTRPRRQAEPRHRRRCPSLFRASTMLGSFRPRRTVRYRSKASR